MHQFHDRHDGRTIHLGRSHWLRDQFIASGPVLFAPLDPFIYSAAESYQRRVSSTTDSSRHSTCHQKRDAANPWHILMDDDSVSGVELGYLTSGGKTAGQKQECLWPGWDGSGGGGVASVFLAVAYTRQRNATTKLAIACATDAINMTGGHSQR